MTRYLFPSASTGLPRFGALSSQATVRDAPLLPVTRERPRSAEPRTGSEVGRRLGRQGNLAVEVTADAVQSRCVPGYGSAEKHTGLRCSHRMARDTAVGQQGRTGRSPCRVSPLKGDRAKHSESSRTDCSTPSRRGVDGQDAAARRVVARAETPVRSRAASSSRLISPWSGNSSPARPFPGRLKARGCTGIGVPSPAFRGQSPSPPAVTARSPCAVGGGSEPQSSSSGETGS